MPPIHVLESVSFYILDPYVVIRRGWSRLFSVMDGDINMVLSNKVIKLALLTVLNPMF